MQSVLKRMSGVFGLVLPMMVVGSLSAGEAPKSTPELVKKGEQIYKTNCMVCHGEKGDGNGPAGAALNPKPRDLRVKDETVGKHYKAGGKPEQLFKTISEGLPGTAMIGYSSTIPNESDRWAVVYYIKEKLQAGK